MMMDGSTETFPVLAVVKCNWLCPEKNIDMVVNF